MTNFIALPLFLTLLISPVISFSGISRGPGASTVSSVFSHTEQYELMAGKRRGHVFTMARDERIYIELDADSEELTFGVYDESGSLVARKAFVCDRGTQFAGSFACVIDLEYVAPKEGKYRVIVGNPTNTTQEYELKVGNLK
jgi:hypothetical protein